MNRILIIGGDSLIGSSLYNFLSKHEAVVHFTSRKHEESSQNSIYLDLLNTKYISYIKNYSHIILAAGLSGYANCEANPEISRKINVNFVNDLLSYLKESNTKLIYLSSTAVFDGQNSAPNEDQIRNPQTIYGQQKCEAEDLIKAHSRNYSILRLTKVCDTRKGIFLDIYNSIKYKKEISLYNNIFISPISLQYISNAVSRILPSQRNQVIHLSNEAHLTYHEFGKLVAKKMSVPDDLIKECVTQLNTSVISHNNLGMVHTTKSLNIKPEPLDLFIKNFLSVFGGSI